MIATHIPTPTRFRVDPTSCAVLLEARSNVGGVRFASQDLSGEIEVLRSGDVVDTTSSPSARLAVPVASLTSGNALYDAELQQRLGLPRHPLVTIELIEATLLNGHDYQVSGTMSIHGVTSTLTGGVTLHFPEPGSVLITGEHVVDIRDFNIELPSLLMLRIYPDVKVSIHVLATEIIESEVSV